MTKGADILRLVDSIHREKNIDKEIVFESLETAMFSAARKKLGNSSEIFVEIDRKTGDITAFDGENQIDPIELGRIAALTFKQVMIQKVREAERDVVYDEYIKKVHTLITGTIQRAERPNVIVNLGRAEGIVPWREQVPNETYNVGDRIKCLVLEVKQVRQQVRIVLSRSSPDLLRHLFELEVPEVAERIIEIRELARDAGHRAKVAVISIDSNVDCVGACVGIRGSRIKNIVEELNGERIDIVRWNEAPDIFIRNAMKPAEVNEIELDYETRKARLYVNEDQLSLAIGRRGQNVRLASALTGWEIDLLTGTPSSPEERFQVDRRDRRGQTSTTASPESKLDSILPSPGATPSSTTASAAPTSAASKLDAILSAPKPTSDEAESARQDEPSSASEGTDPTLDPTSDPTLDPTAEPPAAESDPTASPVEEEPAARESGE